MKIEVIQETFVKALATLQKGIPTKPSLPILSSILIQAENDTITLSATDLFLGIQTTVAGTITEPGTIAIPGKLLYETVSALNPGKVTLSQEEEKLVIKTSDGKTSIQCPSSEDYPSFPEIQGTTYVVPWETFEHIITSVSFSVSTDVTRPVLTGLLLEFSNTSITAVGTDGFRLSVMVEPLESEGLSEPQRLLIPAKALQEVFKIGDAQSLQSIAFTVSNEQKQALFEVGQTKLFTRLIDGDYPPYEKIIPTMLPVQITFDSDELAKHLKRALIFARESSNIIHLEITPEKMLVKASSASAGTHQSELNLTHLGTQQEATIAFNARYVQEYLNHIKTEQTWFGMSESLKPAIMRPVDRETFKYIVMPFRVNS